MKWIVQNPNYNHLNERVGVSLWRVQRIFNLRYVSNKVQCNKQCSGIYLVTYLLFVFVYLFIIYLRTYT